jgi:hypothetical protein
MGTKVLQMPATVNPGWSTFFEFYALPPDSTTGWGYKLVQSVKSVNNTSLVRDDNYPTFRAINVMSDVVEISGGQYYVSFLEFPQGKKIETPSGLTFWAFPEQKFNYKKAVRVVQSWRDGALVVNGVPEQYDTTFFVLPVPAAGTPAVRLAATLVTASDAQVCSGGGRLLGEEVYLSPEKLTYAQVQSGPLPCAQASAAQLQDAALRGGGWGHEPAWSKWGLAATQHTLDPVLGGVKPVTPFLDPARVACYGVKPAAADVVNWGPGQRHDPALRCSCNAGYTPSADGWACARACCSVCKNLDAAGRCTDCDATAATKLDGKVFGKGAGMYVPTLTLDPTTLRVLGDGVNPATCARNLDSVKAMFSEFPPQTLKVKAPGGAPPDIFQIFGFLKTKGIYVPPK